MTSQVKQKRSRDGCQNCKLFKIKCNRAKPICNVCLRRGLECDYSKKMVWVSVDKTDSRHPSFKNLKKKSVVKVESNEEEVVSLDPKDPMINTIDEYKALQSNVITIENKFFKFINNFDPEITKIFNTKGFSTVYEHYLIVTCSSLDPLHGSGPENISQKFFLPVAVNDPSTLHGILSISSSQLSNTNPSYKEIALIHKSLAFKHLYSLFSSSKKSISIEAISAIICQLSIEIIQSGLKNWKIHINALRKIINKRNSLNIQQDQTMWFIYLRVARYDDFACLTTGDEPLFKFSDIKKISSFKTYHPTIQNIDCIFGCPSDILFFCAELSHISKKLWHDKVDGYVIDDTIMELQMFEILNSEYEMDLTDDWSCIKNLWCASMGIHFYQCVKDVNHSEYTKIHITNFFKALNYFITLDSYYCANLLWPILKIGSVLIKNDNINRTLLIDSVELFYEKTKIGAFIQLKSLLSELWELIDIGNYTKPSDWWKYQQERESWNIYLA